MAMHLDLENTSSKSDHLVKAYRGIAAFFKMFMRIFTTDSTSSIDSMVCGLENYSKVSRMQVV